MSNLDKLLKDACERCEEHATNGICECQLTCPVYGLYVEAKKKTKTKIVDRSTWNIPPTPKAEMI